MLGVFLLLNKLAPDQCVLFGKHALIMLTTQQATFAKVVNSG